MKIAPIEFYDHRAAFRVYDDEGHPFSSSVSMDVLNDINAKMSSDRRVISSRIIDDKIIVETSKDNPVEVVFEITSSLVDSWCGFNNVNAKYKTLQQIYDEMYPGVIAGSTNVPSKSKKVFVGGN